MHVQLSIVQQCPDPVGEYACGSGLLVGLLDLNFESAVTQDARSEKREKTKNTANFLKKKKADHSRLSPLQVAVEFPLSAH